MAILNAWLDDLPQQFQGKEFIEGLISAFAKQFEEIQEVFAELDLKTDLESAVGKNLDMVGDIVTLTRKEAGVLAGIDVTDPVISDERYRQFLKYQMLVNTNECTYNDLMDGLALLWDVSPIYYKEDPALPAVIILTMPFLTPGRKVVTLGEIPMVKPAGVRIEFQYYIKVLVEIALNYWLYEYSVPRCNTLVCGTYPRRATIGSIMEIRCENDINSIIAAFESNPTGTIRIGGKAYNATLGDVISENIEIEINSNLQIVDVLKAGVSVAGVNPKKAVQGMVIPKDILVDGKLYTDKYKLPATGRQTAGGGELADALSVSIKPETNAETLLSLGTATQIATSSNVKCGNETKIVSVSDNEMESSVNIYIATAKVRRCGTVACGKKE